EARSLYEESLKSQLTKMKDAFQDTAEKYGATAEIDITQMYPGFQFSQSDKVVQIAEEAAKTLDLPCELLKSGGGSDANIFNGHGDRKSTRLNSSHVSISYAVFCLKLHLPHKSPLFPYTTLFRSDTAEKYGATAEIDITQMYPGFQFSQSDKVVQIAEEAAKTLDLPCELLKSGGGSDANIFNGH